MRGTARNEALDFRVAIFAAQHRADADQRKAHVDAEVFQVGRAQVFRVRIVGLSERIEEEFNLLFVVFLMDVAQHAVVTPLDQLRSGLDRVFGQFLLQQLVGDASAPEIVGLGIVFRPRCFLPV